MVEFRGGIKTNEKEDNELEDRIAFREGKFGVITDDLSFVSKPFVYRIELRDEFTYKRPFIEGKVKKTVESKAKTIIVASLKKITEEELKKNFCNLRFYDLMCKIPVFIIEEEVKY